MKRNCEIKARLRVDYETFFNTASKLSTVRAMPYAESLVQSDVFYGASLCRLKTREIKNGPFQLISYGRADNTDAKLSTYCIVEYPRSVIEDTHKVLTMALGRIGKVDKHRVVFLVGQTRVHLDDVTVNDKVKLGRFVELEVVLNDNQTVEEGNKIAQDLMEQLGVKKEDYVQGSYLDLALI
jgi:adenylate cyclase class IV